MKASELRNKSVDELGSELIELRRAQFSLRMQLATQQLNKVDQVGKVTQQVSLTEAQGYHESAIEPDSFEDDIVRHEVADEILFALSCRNIQGLLGHALDESCFKFLFACHRRGVDMR